MKQRILILLLLLAGTLCAVAQQKDTLDVGFDATSKAFEERYKYPDAVPFDKKNWKSRLYFSLYGGMDQLVPRGDGDFSTGPVGGLAVNWQWKKHHTLRGSLLLGNFARKIDNEALTRIGLQLDYLVNVTSAMKGYNPGRIFETMALVGVGYQMSKLADETKGVPELHFGFQMKLHPTGNMDFYIEPRLALTGDGIDHSKLKNWRKYDITYGAVVGLNYRLKSWQPFGKMKRLEGDEFLDNTFVSMAAGGQFQSSPLASEVGLTSSMGPHYTLSAGKWLIPAFALRLSAFQSGDTWHKKVIEATETTRGDLYYEMSTYAGMRLEGMLDATYFFNGHQLQPKFSLNLLAGGEVGVVKKENGRYPTRGGYTGFTGGLQLKYHLFDDLYLFAEPRTTFASYSLQGHELVDGRRVATKYTDKLFSINAGIEIRRSHAEQRSAREVYADEFKPSFFASGAIGFSLPMQIRRYEQKRYFGYNAMLAVGRIFSPIHSLRLAGDFSPLTVDVKGGTVKYQMPSLSIDYLLNLSNLMMGFDDERPYDVQLFGGPVVTMRMQPSQMTNDDELNESRTLFGVEAGIQASYRVSSRFKVFLEPKLRIYGGNVLLRQSTVQGKDLVMLLAAGTSFSF